LLRTNGRLPRTSKKREVREEQGSKAGEKNRIEGGTGDSFVYKRS